MNIINRMWSVNNSIEVSDITGGEPLLFPEKLANLAESIKTVQKLAYGNKGKLFLYTALADMLPNYIRKKIESKRFTFHKFIFVVQQKIIGLQ